MRDENRALQQRMQRKSVAYSHMVMREIKPIGKALIDKAKKGDVTATRELFDRAFGRAPQNAPIDSLNSNAAIPTPILSNLFLSPETIERHNLRTQPTYRQTSTKESLILDEWERIGLNPCGVGF